MRGVANNAAMHTACDIHAPSKETMIVTLSSLVSVDVSTPRG